MTTPPVDGEAPDDMRDPTPDIGPGAGSDDEDSDDGDSGDTDAMGINDDDPIDATLVGEPVEGGDRGDESTSPEPAATGSETGPDSDSDSGSGAEKS